MSALPRIAAPAVVSLLVVACGEATNSPTAPSSGWGVQASAIPVVTTDWDMRAPMPTARGALIAESVGDRIYVIGGANRYCCQPTVPVTEAYDPIADSWTIASPPPDDDMWGPASAVVDGRIYVIGGWPDGGNTTRLYDPQIDQWSYLAPSPSSHTFGHATAVVNGEIYVMGGSDGPHVSKYAPSTDTWTTGFAPLPIVRARNQRALSAAPIDGLIYVVGAADTLLIYDSDADSWSEGARLPANTWRPSVRAIAQHIYLFGGSTVDNNGGGDVAHAQVYDPATDSWGSIPEMLSSRYWTAVAEHAGTVHVFGGWGLDNDAPLALHESLALATDPTHKDDCKDGGWQQFGFRNQGQCIRFVNTGKDSR